MNLSTRGRYAVMAMADIARFGGEAPVALGDIARRQGISLTYLEQLFAKLRRAGMVASVRGPGGGYRLVADPHEIRLSDIMFAAEEQFRTTRCEGEPGNGCECTKPCATHDLWAALGAHIASFLAAVTLADVVAGRPEAFVSPGPGCRSVLEAADMPAHVEA